MYIEITKEAFKRLIAIDTKCDKVESKELCVKYHYISPYGVQLLQIDNFIGGYDDWIRQGGGVSCTSQYYIQDINA